MDDICRNIEESNLKKKRKVLIVFDIKKIVTKNLIQ